MATDLQQQTGHKQGYDSNCSVCVHEHRPLIENLYLEWHPHAWIIDRFDLDEEDFARHVRTGRLASKKADNRRAFYRHVMENGREALANVSPDTAVKLGMDAAKHVDKLDGLVINRVRDESPKTIVVTASPSPDGYLEEPQGQLGPGGDVVEVDFEEQEDAEE